MATSVESARHQWAEGNRRLSAAASNPDAYEVMMDQVEAVTEEIRRRLGERFTIAQLADVYAAADSWVLDAVEERADRPGWTSMLSVAQDAAFHRYARGATDYTP